MNAIMTITQGVEEIKKKAGPKAGALAQMHLRGVRVPYTAFVPAAVYRDFIDLTGLLSRILLELGRKSFEEMRWEELWDAALRIRNMFLNARLPSHIEDELRGSIPHHFPEKPVAVRSSAAAEDTAGASFAGLHESFLNLRIIDEILKHIVLVWASLWSDAALLYRQELQLDIRTSAMAVIVQEMIVGEKSGVAFGVSPHKSSEAIIESVYGLNKGLVDGDVEPDRWFLDRKTGKILSQAPAHRDRIIGPSGGGVKMVDLAPEKRDVPPLTEDEIKNIFKILQQLQGIFASPQDVEWTIKDDNLFVLQSRAVTVSASKNDDGNRAWYMSLRKSYHNLLELGSRIENELLPKMRHDSEKLGRVELEKLSDIDLAKEIEWRRSVHDQWREVYWDDFIPYAHGARLFGQVYNNRMHPKDPYEFVDLLTSGPMKSLERNNLLQNLAQKVGKSPDVTTVEDFRENGELMREFDDLVRFFSEVSHNFMGDENDKENLMELLIEMASSSPEKQTPGNKNVQVLARKFVESFPDEDLDYADGLFQLGRKSYQLRDDDNIYLGRIESQLNRALEEGRKRLGQKCDDPRACQNIEEVMTALKHKGYIPKKEA
jgi:pyruvate,water dikinase